MTASITVCVIYLSVLNLALAVTFKGWPINKVIKQDKYCHDEDHVERTIFVMESRYTGDVQMGDHPIPKYARWQANAELNRGNLAKLKGRTKKRSLKKISEGKF